MKPTDEKVFKVLITHWINHLENHNQEYRAWSEKMAENCPEASEEINAAFDIMNQATRKLMLAKVAFDKTQK